MKPGVVDHQFSDKVFDKMLRLWMGYLKLMKLFKLGALSYFTGIEKKDERVLILNLGSLTRVHNRARELFYYLKGGHVNYGEEHNKACGHSQFGRIYEQVSRDHLFIQCFQFVLILLHRTLFCFLCIFS
ncbi:hypothetical protein HN51_011863 [Arachis hypogaea]